MARCLVLVALLATAALSGCFDDDVRPGRASAPDWSVGHTWTWEVTRSGSEQERDGPVEEGSARGSLTHTVIGLAPLGDGPPVHWVETRTTGQIGVGFPEMSILDDDALLFIGRDLRILNSADRDSDHPCGGGRAFLRHQDGKEPRTFDLVTFPLKVGSETTGDLGDDARYRAHVAGTEAKTTPAGTFETFRIDLEIALSEEQLAAIELKQRISAWYAPAVEHIVASIYDLEVTFRGGEEQGRFQSKQELLLSAYDLAKGPARLLPDVTTSATVLPGPGATGYRIVSYGDPNIADGPADVEFAVAIRETDADGRPQERRLDAAAIANATDGKTLRWRLYERSAPDTVLAESTGPSFTHTFQDGGAFVVFADPYDAGSEDTCGVGDDSGLVLSASISAYARTIHVVNVTAGVVTEAIEIDRWDLVDRNHIYAHYDITHSPDTGASPVGDLADRGALVLRGPDTDLNVTEPRETVGRPIYDPGPYTISWAPQGKSAPGEQVAPIVSGHTVTVTVVVYWS